RRLSDLEPEDPLRVAEVDRALRTRLQREHGLRMLVRIRHRGDALTMAPQRDLLDEAGVERAEEQVADAGRSEAAVVAERHARRSDRRRVDELRHDRVAA